jgi:ubiquinone/menaquinone biosynthesis C-methylase UbiE
MPPLRVRVIGRTLSALVAHAPWLWGLIRGPVQRFWDRSAARWDVNETPNRTNSLRAALPQMGEPRRILEIGAGTGSGAAILRARFPEADVTGVDLSPEMVRIAQAKVPGVTFEPADASRLPFPDGSFDLVYSNFVVEHLERPPAAFAEWHRVLRPGGSVVVVTSNRSNPLMAAARLLPQGVRTAVKGRGPGAEARDVFPVRYRANTPAALTEQLVRAGFQPVRVVPVATLHRYAGRRRAAATLLRGIERALPPRLRSTIVAWYRR